MHPDFTVRHWSALDGLPSNTIYALTQAEDGYLWLGTDEGLVRFDGAQFTVFNAINTPELPSNQVGRLQEAPAGYLWMAFETGELVLYHDGRFQVFDVSMGDRYAGSPWIHVEGDTVWIESLEGVWTYSDGQMELFWQQAPNDAVFAVEHDGKGNVWVGTYTSTYRKSIESGLSEPELVFDVGPSFVLYLDRQDRVLVNTHAAIQRIDGERVETLLEGGFYRFHSLDEDGNLWIGERYKGWWRYTPSGEMIFVEKFEGLTDVDNTLIGPDGRLWQWGTSIQNGQGQFQLYRDQELVFNASLTEPRLLFDRQGTLWVGTLGGGLYQVQRSYVKPLVKPEGINYWSVLSIFEDKVGMRWVGTRMGALVRYDESMEPWVIQPEKRTPNISPLWTVRVDRSGTIWKGGDGGVCWMNEDRCILEGLEHFKYSAVRSSLEDREGRLWVGGQHDLFIGEGEGSMRKWTLIRSQDSLPHSFVHSISETREGAFVIGTNGDGVLWLDRGFLDGLDTAVDTLLVSFDVLATEEGLPSNHVQDVYEDKSGLFWIALEDRGLCRLALADDSIGDKRFDGADLRCLDNRNGLYQSGIHYILEDDFGRFWFNTNNGLFWVERANLMAFLDGEIPAVTSVSYTEAQGMANRKGNGGQEPGAVKDDEGRLWFPTEGGVIVVDPSEIPAPSAPSIRVEGIALEGTLKRVPEAGPLRLDSDERDFTIHYTALEFKRPQDVRFQYLMEGYDKEWHDGGTQARATYTNLPPGSYTFLVKSGIGGAWSETAHLSIELAPHVWETWWFFGGLFGSSLCLAVLLYGARIRDLKARETELERIVTERTEQLVEKAAELEQANEMKSHFLANLSHEFRTPLTLTFGPIDDLLHGRFAVDERARPYLESARRNGSRLLNLINQLLDLSRFDAGTLALNTRRRDISMHLSQIAALFESLAETRGIQLETNIPEKPLFHEYDVDMIEKVVVNLLANAFKFTSAGGTITLNVYSEEDGAIRFFVSDTGIGIAEKHLPYLFDRFYQVDHSATREHEGTGIGLAITKEMVELHGGNIDVASNVGVGTRFTVYLPPVNSMTPNEFFFEGDNALTSVDAVIAELSTLELSGGRPAEATDHVEAFTTSESDQDSIILVIEDNADMRAYIRGHLQDHFTLAEAKNGKAGVERAIEIVPDLILSDVMMPVMDGLEASATLKADERTSHIPIVLLTARAQVEHRIAGYESGADTYLPKPFNAEELLVRVRTMIEDRRRLKNRFSTQELVLDQAGGSPEKNGQDVLPPKEEAFLDKVKGVIDERLGDVRFGVDTLAEELSMSRRQLYRKLTALTGSTPSSLLRQHRLARAAALLEAGELSVKEICFRVGFLSESSFARAFRQVYGVPPSAYPR